MPDPTGYLNQLGERVHANARAKGFYDHATIEADPDVAVANPSIAAEKLALIHSEVSETLEALRDNDREHEAEELADVLIRVVDYAAFRNLDLDAAVAAKIAVNAERPRLHGRSW